VTASSDDVRRKNLIGTVDVFLSVPFRAVSFHISGVGVGLGVVIWLLILSQGKATGKTTPPKPKAKEKAITAIAIAVIGLTLSLKSIPSLAMILFHQYLI